MTNSFQYIQRYAITSKRFKIFLFFHLPLAMPRCLATLSKYVSPDKSIDQFVHDAIVEPLIVVVYILSSIFIFSTFEAHGNSQYGFNRSEGWTLIDCTYFTAQTMSTVGYGDISPASKDGPRIFAVWMVSLLCCDLNGAMI